MIDGILLTTFHLMESHFAKFWILGSELLKNCCFVCLFVCLFLILKSPSLLWDVSILKVSFILYRAFMMKCITQTCVHHTNCFYPDMH